MLNSQLIDTGDSKSSYQLVTIE